MRYPELKSKAIKGILALTSRSVFLYVIKIVAFTILGVFLNPAQIGMFFVVSAIRDILALFSDVGLGPALVQKQDEPSPREYASTFFVQEVLVVIVVSLGWFFTDRIAAQIGLDAEGVVLYHVILVTLVINSLKAIPSIRLERRLAFNRQVIPQIVEELVFNSVVVYLAWQGFGTTSYSVAVLSSAFIGLIVYYIVSPWFPILAFSWEGIKKLLTYGIQFQGKSYLAVVKDQMLTILLARLVGPEGIGYWGWAQRYAYSPFRFIVDNVTKVTFPTYSRIQDDKALLGKAIDKSLFGVSFTLFPILSLMIVAFPHVVSLIPKFSKWEIAIPSFYLLCLSAGLSAISNVLITALDATGRVRTTLALMIFWIFLTWTTTVVLVTNMGFTGISAASLIVSATVFITIFLVKRQIAFSLTRSVIPFVIASGLSGLVSWSLIAFLPSNFIMLVLGVIAGGISYVLFALAFSREELHRNFKLIYQSLRNGKQT